MEILNAEVCEICGCMYAVGKPHICYKENYYVPKLNLPKDLAKEITVKNTIALINSQEQEIFELENRLKECENGYEGTLHLDRCKLHDAEQKIKELTEENKAWQMQLISKEEKVDKAYYDLACEVEDLRAENENLHASCTELTQSCTKLTEENERLRGELTGANKDKQILFDEIASLEAEAEKAIDIAEGNIRAEIASCGTSCHWCEDKVKADTVRKMHSEIKERCIKGGIYPAFVASTIDQIAKEMLEGSDG